MSPACPTLWTTPGASLSLPSGVWDTPQSQEDQGQSDKTRLGRSWSPQPPLLLCDTGMVATEGPRPLPEAHLRRNKLGSDLYKTALMTKPAENTFGCVSGAIKHPSVQFPGPCQAWEGEGLVRHLLAVQHIPREGSGLQTRRNPLQDPPRRTILLPASPAKAGDASVTCSGSQAPHFGSSSIATTLPIPEGPREEPSSSRSLRERRFQTGASPAESLRHWKRSWLVLIPTRALEKRRIQSSAAAGRGGEEIHGQEDEVNHHQHRAWGQRGVRELILAARG